MGQANDNQLKIFAENKKIDKVKTRDEASPFNTIGNHQDVEKRYRSTKDDSITKKYSTSTRPFRRRKCSTHK